MKAGLEVHQQLATGKLFCACPSNLSEPSLGTIRRRLLATRGEESEIDPAARAQAGREFVYEYEVAPESCLVELDEEPPHAINPEALDVALTIALLLNARVLDEIEVMRKIVVDGSNTSGFQRTALIAVDGTLEARGRRYSIPTICLEEDAARKVGEKQALVRY
ncbi:MAG: Glu-tRNA(Gln) amidotransferase GatDE subunit E, partial [Thermoplasmata archaeon]